MARSFRFMLLALFIGFVANWAVAALGTIAPLATSLVSMTVGTSAQYRLAMGDEEWFVGLVSSPLADQLTAIHLSAAQTSALSAPIPGFQAAATNAPFTSFVDFQSSAAPISTHVTAARAGWPFRSFGASVRQTWTDTRSFPFMQLSEPNPSGAILLFEQDPLTRHFSLLPLTPLWPGLVANTLLYGLIFWLARLAIHKLRRLWWELRHRPGYCDLCRYPLTEQSRCPECGCAVRG